LGVKAAFSGTNLAFILPDVDEVVSFPLEAVQYNSLLICSTKVARALDEGPRAHVPPLRLEVATSRM
jgi:hypothetical protein